MNLIEKKITKKLGNYDEIVKFMKKSFPKEELMPMWLLLLVSKFKKYNFNAYYDDKLFVGIIFTIESKESVFVFYIAVNDQIQSRGYGTRLLEIVFDKNKGKSVSLFIETMSNKNASNFEQRIKRLSFYERNGFKHTGYSAGNKEPFIDILSTNDNFDLKDAKKLLKIMPMKIFVNKNQD